MKKTKRTWWFVLIASLFFFAAHRLPAPVVEVPEKPAASEQESDAKPKRSHKSRSHAATEKQTEPTKRAMPSGPARFSGTWAGTVNFGFLVGNVLTTLNVNPEANSVTEKSSAGQYVHPATSSGDTLSWRSGWFKEIAWTFRPNPDGQTAMVAVKGGLGVNASVTFRRTQDASGSEPAAANPTINANAKATGIPTAQPVPNKPGYVYNPFEPSIMLDVRGRATGSKAKDPSGRLFTIP